MTVNEIITTTEAGDLEGLAIKLEAYARVLERKVARKEKDLKDWQRMFREATRR